MNTMPVVGYEGLYAVSDEGDVFRVAPGRGAVPGRKLALWIGITHGYQKVTLFRQGARSDKVVHRLVAEAFLENPHCYDQINHLDGVKTNNRVENLQWCTCEQNLIHAFETGLTTKIRRNIVATHLTTGEQLRFSSMGEAARYGFLLPSISSCCNGKRKTHKGYRWVFETPSPRLPPPT